MITPSRMKPAMQCKSRTGQQTNRREMLQRRAARRPEPYLGAKAIVVLVPFPSHLPHECQLYRVEKDVHHDAFHGMQGIRGTQLVRGCQQHSLSLVLQPQEPGTHCIHLVWVE